jgi:hypothetical protein
MAERRAIEIDEAHVVEFGVTVGIRDCRGRSRAFLRRQAIAQCDGWGWRQPVIGDCSRRRHIAVQNTPRRLVIELGLGDVLHEVNELRRGRRGGIGHDRAETEHARHVVVERHEIEQFEVAQFHGGRIRHRIGVRDRHIGLHIGAAGIEIRNDALLKTLAGHVPPIAVILSGHTSQAWR